MPAHPFTDAIRNVPVPCSHASPGRVEYQDQRFVASAEVATVGPLAAELRSLTFAIPATSHWPIAQLNQQAKLLAERVQYLLEPLSVIETDHESATVQIRSTKPVAMDEGQAYYEVLARAGSLHLCRYLTRPGSPRQTTPMQLTYEQLQRLVGDVDDVIDAT